MIYDKLTNIGLYKGTNRNLDTAIDYILNNDIYKLPLGRTSLDGDLVYINVMEADAGPLETRNYEIHKEYMDIQIDLSGMEMIQIGDSAEMTVKDYNPQTDFGVAECADLTSCTMGPGNFIICMAGEPHKPGIAVSDQTAMKKCVFKVHK